MSHIISHLDRHDSFLADDDRPLLAVVSSTGGHVLE